MFETVIGLEIHVQLMTKSKIFSGAATEFGAGANSQASAVDLGLPGVLPVLNIEAVRMAVKFGLAIGAEVNQTSIFARKNYFYPDLPKGYQISQLDLPIVGTGSIEILTGDNSKIIGITRAHLEEDAGKSVHDMSSDWTAIDLNRAGTPLLEIVSEPDLRSATEAVEYAKKIRTLVQYLQICDGNMAEGSMRFDANVSVRPIGQETLGTRTELKNLNSFKFLEQAVNLEVERQIEVLEDGGKIAQETRLYDEKNHQTRPMRSKEEANDYRYFPDPDLLPIVLDDDFLAAINQDLPELPDARKSRFITEFGLNDADALSLTSSKSLADYFEQMTKVASAKLCANWVIGELRFMLNKTDIKLENAPISPLQLAELLSRISDNTISGKIAKDVFRLMWEGHGSADEIIAARGLQQLGDVKAIEAIVDEVIKNHQEQVEQIRSGNKKVLGFLVGQVLKASAGKANPQQANEILNNKI